MDVPNDSVMIAVVTALAAAVLTGLLIRQRDFVVAEGSVETASTAVGAA